jgi:hypothetical protein
MMDESPIITFDYIPRLGPGPGTLMPTSGGQAGVEYAQVCTHHVVRARREGWKPVPNAEPYVISGPDGFAEVMLMQIGDAIRGAPAVGGAQICRVDREVYTLTGYQDPDAIKEPRDGKAKSGKREEPPSEKEGLAGDEGIQARQPSV